MLTGKRKRDDASVHWIDAALSEGWPALKTEAEARVSPTAQISYDGILPRIDRAEPSPMARFLDWCLATPPYDDTISRLIESIDIMKLTDAVRLLIEHFKCFQDEIIAAYDKRRSAFDLFLAHKHDLEELDVTIHDHELLEKRLVEPLSYGGFPFLKKVHASVRSDHLRPDDLAAALNCVFDLPHFEEMRLTDRGLRCYIVPLLVGYKHYWLRDLPSPRQLTILSKPNCERSALAGGRLFTTGSSIAIEDASRIVKTELTKNLTIRLECVGYPSWMEFTEGSVRLNHSMLYLNAHPKDVAAPFKAGVRALNFEYLRDDPWWNRIRYDFGNLRSIKCNCCALNTGEFAPVRDLIHTVKSHDIDCILYVKSWEVGIWEFVQSKDSLDLDAYPSHFIFAFPHSQSGRDVFIVIHAGDVFLLEAGLKCINLCSFPHDAWREAIGQRGTANIRLEPRDSYPSSIPLILSVPELETIVASPVGHNAAMRPLYCKIEERLATKTTGEGWHIRVSDIEGCKRVLGVADCDDLGGIRKLLMQFLSLHIAHDLRMYIRHERDTLPYVGTLIRDCFQTPRYHISVDLPVAFYRLALRIAEGLQLRTRDKDDACSVQLWARQVCVSEIASRSRATGREECEAPAGKCAQERCLAIGDQQLLDKDYRGEPSKSDRPMALAAYLAGTLPRLQLYGGSELKDALEGNQDYTMGDVMQRLTIHGEGDAEKSSIHAYLNTLTDAQTFVAKVTGSTAFPLHIGISIERGDAPRIYAHFCFNRVDFYYPDGPPSRIDELTQTNFELLLHG